MNKKPLIYLQMLGLIGFLCVSTFTLQAQQHSDLYQLVDSILIDIDQKNPNLHPIHFEIENENPAHQEISIDQFLVQKAELDYFELSEVETMDVKLSKGVHRFEEKGIPYSKKLVEIRIKTFQPESNYQKILSKRESDKGK